MIALSQVHAQMLTEKWTVGIPTDMSSLTINIQGTRYAYLIDSGKALVRGNALTGMIVDTVVVPDLLQVEYAHDVLYGFYKDTANVYRFVYMSDDSDTLGIVLLIVPAIQTSISSSLYSRISIPTLRMLGNLQSIEVDVHREDRDYDQFVTEYSHCYRVIRDSLITGIHASGNDATESSADGSQVLKVDEQFRSHRVGGGEDFYEHTAWFSEYYVDSLTFNHRFTRRDTYASTFLPVQCSGILGIALRKGVVTDYRRDLVLYGDTTLVRSIGNLWSGGYQLVREPWTNRLYCYNIATRQQQMILQSDTNRLVASMAYHARQASSTLFAVNRKRDELLAYQIASPPPNEHVVFVRDHDTIRINGIVRCSATLYAEADGCIYHWYVNDSLWSTTNVPEAQLSFDEAGVYRLKVTVMRDSTVFVASDTNDRDLVVLGVGGFDFSLRVSDGPVLDLSINDQGTHLGCSLQDTVALLHTVPVQGEITSVRRVPYMGGIGFLPQDSVIVGSTLRREYGEYELPTSFVLYNLNGDSIGFRPKQSVPRSMSTYDYNGQPRTDYFPTALSSVLIRNHHTSMYYWFTRYSRDWPLDAQRGHIMKLSIGDTATFYPRDFGGPCRFTSIPTGACMAFNKKVFLVDFPAYFITDSITAPKGMSFNAAVLTDSNVVITNLGVYRRDTAWQLITPHTFPGTTGLLTMSNPNYYIAVVQTVSASAHVISRATGAIVHTFPTAFHYATAAAYDSVYRMLYIGDSTGYITAWSVPTEFAVSVEEQPQEAAAHELTLIPNPASGSVRFLLPKDASIVSCLAVGTLGTAQYLDVTLTHDTPSSAVADISSLSPGMYVFVLNTTQRTTTANLMVLRP